MASITLPFFKCNALRMGHMRGRQGYCLWKARVVPAPLSQIPCHFESGRRGTGAGWEDVCVGQMIVRRADTVLSGDIPG